MDFFNKAKEAAEKLTGGGDSTKKDDKKESESIFTKAIGAVDKYHVKDKAVEYAQKQVAKREEEKLQPGYVEKKDKSIVDKAKEAAEDFLAKQGDKPTETPVSKPVKSRSRSSSSSSSSSSDSEKERPKSPQFKPVVEQQAIPPIYPSNTGANIEASLGRMNLDRDTCDYERYPSSSGKYETYQEYWIRRSAVDNTQTQPSYSNDSSYSRQLAESSPYYPSGAENSSSYYQDDREAQSYSRRPGGDSDRNYSGGNYSTRQYQSSEEYYRSPDDRNYLSGSESGRYQSSKGYIGRSGGEGRNYPSYTSGTTSSSGYSHETSSRPYGHYASNGHV
ncbi:hypothetical protein PInf_007765 [Phytophthora infestans]|nr:hypothetical protein PInf_007765 [Phytophthora infestans]